MSETKIANRYAEALIQEAQAGKKLVEVAQNMADLSSACSKSNDLRNALKNPIINPQQKLNALLEIFKGFEKTSLDFIRLVCNRNREDILPNIAEAYLSLYRVQQGIVKVNVQSAAPLSENDKNDIKVFVQKNTGARSVELHSEINADIIGGLVIKFGDKLLDTSIAAKLRKLKKELNIA